MPDVFRLDGQLPKGRTVIEASAGTGKTYTLASLVVRYICETEVEIDQLLVVTFTRAAAGELRDRIRSRLIQASEIIDSAWAPAGQLRFDDPVVDDDPLSQLLHSLPRANALLRITKALNNFDAATITTIHGFAQQALSAMGASTPMASNYELVGTDIELVEQACTDSLIRQALGAPETTNEMPTWAKLKNAVLTVLNNPGIDLSPTMDDENATRSARRFHALIVDAVALIHERRRRRGITTYDELLSNLQSVIGAHPDTAAQLRQRYKVALIDEFQDTDAQQWRVFSEIFTEHDTLVLVADPKQAIYSFRGANVYSYLDAARSSSTTSLTTNFRSDEAVLATTNALFAGATFGSEEIGFGPVEPSPEARGRRMRDADGKPLPALHIRTVLGPHLERKDPTSFVANAGEIREYVATDLAGHIKDLLAGAHLPPRGTTPGRSLQASDIAVLVRSHADGATQYRALRRLGIPAVSSNTGSVLESLAFDHWRYLLRSLEQPTNPQRARTAAKTWFFGWSDEKIVANRSEDFGRLHEILHQWAELLRHKGVNAFCTAVFEQSDVRMHALDTENGDRNFTDLEHIAEILRSLAPESSSSAAVLCARLENLAGEYDSDDLLDATERRVESADNAVQIMTIFAAKGLQFPVVCVPEMYRPPRAGLEVPFQHPDTGRRTFDLDTTVSASSKELMAKETLGEHLRLLYVALTRAQHQTILWWSRAPKQSQSALSHLLFARRDGVLDSAAHQEIDVEIPDDANVASKVKQIFSSVGDAFTLTEVDRPGYMTYTTRATTGVVSPPSGTDALEVTTFDRVLDRRYGRWSFTAVTANSYLERTGAFDETLGDAGAHDELGDHQESDEQNEDTAELSDLPLGSVPGGAAFGTLVHSVLERTDFASPLLREEIAVTVRRGLETSSWPVSEGELVEGLMATISSPLGPLFDGVTLRDIQRKDRLDELSFEIHLGAGSSSLSVSDIGRLACDHLDGRDPLSAWAMRLANNEIDADLHGHLTGSIDLIARVPSPVDAQPRYVIADYKTNRLSRYRQPSLARDFVYDLLPSAMVEHHYPLQALLYGVALHRYLRWRQPAYDPEVHLGGAAYLFIRGMAGPTTPIHGGHPNGVFSWPFPKGLIPELSDLLAAGGSR